MMRAAVAHLVLALLCVVPVRAAHSGQPRAQPGPTTAIERITALLEQNDLASATAEADRAVLADPSDPAVHNLAGVVDAQRGAHAAAETHFLTAIRLAPRASGPYTNLGRLYQERSGVEPGARAKALDVYRRLLAIDPSHVEGLFQAAFLLALDGAFGESRTLIGRLPEDVRASPQVLAVLATDLEGLGDQPGARAAAAALASHARLTAADVSVLWPAFAHLRDEALPRRLIEALDARQLATPDLLQRLAGMHTRHGRFAEARQVLERAAAAGPTVPLLTDLARTAHKQGDAKGALGYLAHARSLAPRNAGVHFLFGMICVELNLGREAYDSLKTAVELDPDNPLVNYAMGAVATHRHEPSESVPYFETYVRLRPDDPRGRFALGAARFYSGQFDAARRDLEVAARSTETATGAHYFLGRIARQTQDLDTARREIDQALRASPQYADAWAELGLIQTRAGDYAAAEAALSKALALDPDNYDATLNLAALYGRTKDPRRPAQEARLAALIEKRDARTQEFLRIIEVVP
jgi:Tfp pilus assembly protein PilF